MISRSIVLLCLPFLVICLVAVPNVQAQASGITSITDFKYTAQANLQNGVAKTTVTFTVYYNYYYNPQGYLVFGIRYAENSKYVPGSATSTPDSCQSLPGTVYAGVAACAIIPYTPSGTESASFSLTFDSARQYALRAIAGVVDPSGNFVRDSQALTEFTVTVTGQAVSSSQTSNTQVTASATQSTASTVASATQSTASTVASGQNVTPQDNTTLILAGVALIVVLALVVGLVFLRQRGTRSKMQGIVVPSAAPRRSPPPRVEAPEVGDVTSVAQPKKGFKYCVHCGATIPAVVVFCTKCGKKQQ